MKKQLLTALGVFCLITGSNAQEEKPANLRHPCNTFEAMEEGFNENPKLKAQFEASQAQFEQQYAAAIQAQALSKTAAATYTIPIVFHIMGDQNISDQVFINLVSYFNRDYAKLGADTTTINPAFASLYKDSGIRFALAKRDPNGNCTDGIIRHSGESIYWSQSSPNYKFSGTGTNRWPTNKYLNIYIVECISSTTYSCPTTNGAFIGGYTYLPGGTPYTTNGNMGDAIVLLKNQLAQSDPLDSRTISHEIGHWLNLSHTFGSTNNPKFDPSNMPTSPVTCSTDNVSDTPPTGGYFSTCATSTLDCSTPNIENIMDYASCPKMFTQGQITRMTTALNSSTGGRNNLWTAANYLATGLAGGYTCTPVADFVANKGGICQGSTVTYTSTSLLGDNGGSVSWIFAGGTPATSTNSVETVTYPTAGTYSVSLAATNPQGTNTKTVSTYMNVFNGAGGSIVPAAVDFETTGLPSGLLVRNNNTGSPTWAQSTATGGNSTTKSIYLNNFSSTNTKGHRDFFETPFYDFSNTSSIGFSFYYAYAKRFATQIDSFKVHYSLDCGATWTQILGLPTMNTMASSSGGTLTTNFVPTSTQWKLFTANTSLLSSLANKPSVKFRFYFMSDKANNGSNNMYVDQINIIGNITTGITDLEKSMELMIYPNPTNSSATIDFTLAHNEKVKVTVTDIIGRVVEENNLSLNEGQNSYTINKNSALSKGVYIINLDINNQRISKKLIIE